MSNGLPDAFSWSIGLLPELWLTKRTTATSDPAPSLRPHYRDITATTRRSASASGPVLEVPTGHSRLGHSRSAALLHATTPDAPSHVPCESGRPRSRRLHAGRRLASRRAPARLVPEHCRIARASTSSDYISTLRQRSSSRSPPDASWAPFPHRSPRRSSANAACGGLEPPPAGRLRGAFPHLSHSTASRCSISYITGIPSAFRGTPAAVVPVSALVSSSRGRVRAWVRPP